MATDVLILGDFIFDDWSTPERLPFGGKQTLSVQKMPGGSRVVDLWGPDDEDRVISAKFWGEDAVDNALALDAMRAQGVELPYSNGIEARTVVIAEFHAKVIKVQYVEFDMVLVTTDDSGTGAGGGGFGGGLGIGLPSLDLTIGADLSISLSLVA